MAKLQVRTNFCWHPWFSSLSTQVFSIETRNFWEMMDTNLQKYGATKHCAYGPCNNDTRYQHKTYMKGISWINFPKPKTNLDKRQWMATCGRKNFTVKDVKKWTYICSKYFVDGRGSTEENPDPLPAHYTPEQVRLVYLFIRSSYSV